MGKEYILEQFNIEDNEVYSIFSYGSRVYRNFDSKSDYDYIIVLNQAELKIESISNKTGNLNATFYSVNGFNRALEEHEISVLECIFLPDEYVIKNTIDYKFTLDLFKLRISISSKSSNSFVKAMKKLTIEKDYNVRIARKSLYHSLRILLFGIQLAKYGKICNFQDANYIWYEIIKMSSDWDKLKTKFVPMRNELATKFKKLAPIKKIT